MTRHGPRRSEQARGDRPAEEAPPPEAPEAAAAAAAPKPDAPPEGRVPKGWRLTLLVWAAAFVVLCLCELVRLLLAALR